MLVILGLISVPTLSILIDTEVITPAQLIGNFMSFETGPTIIFPGLNNSYLIVDRSLMKEDKRIEYAHQTKIIPNKTYDIIIIGDSFTEQLWGLPNGISRQGNFSAIIFNYNSNYDCMKSPLVLVENLISSGFIDTAKPKFILFEAAGRGDPINIYSKMASTKDRIAYDIPSLNYWIHYGSNIDNIVIGLQPKTNISLLKLPMETGSNVLKERKNSIQIVTSNEESAILECPAIGENAAITFSHILISPDTTLITKVGADNVPKNNGNLNEIRSQIIVTYEDGTEETVFNQFIRPDEGFRLVSLPMVKFSGMRINLTFVTYPSDNYNVTINKIYWVNPTLVSYPLSGEKYTIGDNISFAMGGRSNSYISEGWTVQGPNDRFTDGHEASIILFIENKSENVYLSLNAYAFTYPPHLNSQIVRISVNNKDLSKPIILYGTLQHFSIPIPSGYLINGKNSITFSLPNATSPESFGFEGDDRILGMAVSSIALTTSTSRLTKTPITPKESVQPEDNHFSRPFTTYGIISDPTQSRSVFRMRDTIMNTIKNQFDLPIPATNKARLTKRIHSSNVEFDTIYYDPTADLVRKNYRYKTLVATNNNFNNLSDRLNQYNITLIYLIPPDTSHIYEEYYVFPPESRAAQMYDDVRTIPKKYKYIDAEALIKDRVREGELDLYPIFTRHWSPKTGSYVAAEIVRIMNNLTANV